MTDDSDKRWLRRSVQSLTSLIALKTSKPTDRVSCDVDRRVNELIRDKVRLINKDKYFKDLIIEDQDHDAFLDLWEQLDYFVNKWSYPYQVLNDVEWEEEKADLNGIGKDLMDVAM